MCEIPVENNEKFKNKFEYGNYQKKIKLSPLKSFQTSSKFDNTKKKFLDNINFGKEKVKYFDSPVKLIEVSQKQKSTHMQKHSICLPIIGKSTEKQRILLTEDFDLENEEFKSNDSKHKRSKSSFKHLKRSSENESNFKKTIPFNNKIIMFQNDEKTVSVSNMNSYNFNFQEQRMFQHFNTKSDGKRSSLITKIHIPDFDKLNDDDDDEEISKVRYESSSNQLIRIKSIISDDENIDEKEVKKEIEPVIEKINLFKNYSYYEDINSEFKIKMEDFHRVYKKNENEVLFGIFDGHGGDSVAKFVRDRIPELFFAFLYHYNNNYLKAFSESYKKIDEELIFPKAQKMGTTATLLLLTLKNDKKYIYCSNVGDSRGLLISDGNYIRMSYDHKCSDISENERIRVAGGTIINGRINGNINLSRSLGDLGLKKFGLISTPFLFQKEISDADKYIVLASDGVWDVMSDKDIYNISKSIENANQFSRLIVENALKLGSEDNISCLVIEL